MQTTKAFENYPFRIVFISNMVSLGIYGLGFFIVFRLGLIAAVAYLAYVMIFEYRLIRYHCTRCYYWGKVCGFGRGKLSSWLFKKGDVSKFCASQITWKEMIPDMLITLVPVTIGIVMMIIRFDALILSALVIIILLTTAGNGYIRGTLTCSHCKQRELGCPAAMLFNKKTI